MAWEFITQDQLSRRLGPAALRRLYDDNDGGTADANAVTQLRNDASGKVAGYLVGIVDLDAVQTAATAGTAHEVVRLTLDVAVAMAAQRHPEVLPGHDWEALMRQADKDLKQLRESFTKLDTKLAPNPPSNIGGTTYPSESDLLTKPTFQSGGFGDF